MNLGFENVRLFWNYDEDTIFESVDNGCPVFVSAISGTLDGHAWIIDGYIKYNRNSLVHCNWGWHGDCNGYFTSNIFKTQKAEEYDNGMTTKQDFYFKNAINFITYDNPK